MTENSIWELKPYSICKLLGMAFDEKESAKIFYDLRPKSHLNLSIDVPLDFFIHQTLSRVCLDENPASLYIENKLINLFEPYRQKLEGLSIEDIYRYIENGNGAKYAPLPALIWFAVRNKNELTDGIEDKIFATIHIKEHKALRFYDELTRISPDGKAESFLKSYERLKHKCNRLEQKNDKLILEIEKSKKEVTDLNESLGYRIKLNDELREKFEEFGGEPALNKIKILKNEINFLEEEIKNLNDDLLKQPNKKDIKALEGLKVTFFGGLEPLLPSYRQIVESSGGVFYHHSGKELDKKDMKSFVDKSDVIFCPVDTNAHSLRRYIKKSCKHEAKPCYFLRTSSLTTFRKVLFDFIRNHFECKIMEAA